ncbi:flagellar export protein FliJ [Psychromonas antarctica]|jgi:flagellar FliJ protein|uniref:flagellar export protein FliJ n=1 Tax=Psychromonas antarctica TaxID=67573 RepID=UPI001EE789DB|nr:flagellar export protein FliJ [Psychromonas antarctica]MCG6199841.1 flagellar export protein FliJ [Psychromonas antarctica]
MARDALQLVYEQREKQVEQALRAYQQAQQLLFEQRSQLQNLDQYRRQYIAQLTEKGSQGLSISQLGKYQQFIVQIDQGLTKQQQGLVKFEYDVHAQKKRWLESQVSCKAMAMLLKKKALQKVKIADRKEQQLLDEFSTFQFFQKKTTS